ncbi:hypothetical protein SDJN03_07408, partial [Cucurbita argyrosperma subsp. sororia]
MKPSSSSMASILFASLLLLSLSLVTLPSTATANSDDASPSPPPSQRPHGHLRSHFHIRSSRAMKQFLPIFKRVAKKQEELDRVFVNAPWPMVVVLPSPPPPFR